MRQAMRITAPPMTSSKPTASPINPKRKRETIKKKMIIRSVMRKKWKDQKKQKEEGIEREYERSED